MIVINGENITKEEAAKLIRMLCEDAKRIAGEFHGMERSAKFRINWPNEYIFAEAEWRNFMEAARAMYAARLGDPKTSPVDARAMHLALVLEAQVSKGAETDNRLQLTPNTQQFVGDKSENRKIIEKFGKVPNFRAALMNAAATLH